MIRSFRSKALTRYWMKGDDRGLRPDWRNKICIVLSRLDVARTPGQDEFARFAVSCADRKPEGSFRGVGVAELAHHVRVGWR